MHNFCFFLLLFFSLLHVCKVIYFIVLSFWFSIFGSNQYLFGSIEKSFTVIPGGKKKSIKNNAGRRLCPSFKCWICCSNIFSLKNLIHKPNMHTLARLKELRERPALSFSWHCHCSFSLAESLLMILMIHMSLTVNVWELAALKKINYVLAS